MKNSITCLSEHIESHPKLTCKDVVKFLHQSEFSTGHMIGENALDMIAHERENLKISEDIPLFEKVGEKYARFNLNSPNASKITDAVIINAMKSCMDIDLKKATESFDELVVSVLKLIEEKKIPLDADEFKGEIALLRESGYAPVSHSDIYRENYKPSYRLVPMWFMQYFDVIAAAEKVMENGGGIIAIDGKSASGKSTLAYNLSQLFDCNVFHMDDFFLQKSQRTPERFAQPGGNVDYERFYDEVYKPLTEKNNVLYRKFDCSKMALGKTETVEYKKLNIVEGAYSMRPEFKDGYALKIFLNIDSEKQKKRILNRNGKAMLERFINEWIPLEEKYFEYFSVADNADIVVNV